MWSRNEQGTFSKDSAQTGAKSEGRTCLEYANVGRMQVIVRNFYSFWKVLQFTSQYEWGGEPGFCYNVPCSHLTEDRGKRQQENQNRENHKKQGYGGWPIKGSSDHRFRDKWTVIQIIQQRFLKWKTRDRYGTPFLSSHPLRRLRQ